MLIHNKIGNLVTCNIQNRHIDYVTIHWYEANKRILVKQTQSGTPIAIKFLNKNPSFTQGDILFINEQTIIAIDIAACNCLVIVPKNSFEVAAICYEIGNKHIPLYVEQDLLLVPFEQPLYTLLLAQGYEVKQQQAKLLQPIKTTVTPHAIDSSNMFFKAI